MLKPLLVRVPADLFKRTKIAAAERDTSLQDVVTKALEAYLGNGGKR